MPRCLVRYAAAGSGWSPAAGRIAAQPYARPRLVAADGGRRVRRVRAVPTGRRRHRVRDLSRTVSGCAATRVDASPGMADPVEACRRALACFLAAALIPRTNPANSSAARSNGATPRGFCVIQLRQLARDSPARRRIPCARLSTHGAPCERASPASVLIQRRAEVRLALRQRIEHRGVLAAC